MGMIEMKRIDSDVGQQRLYCIDIQLIVTTLNIPLEQQVLSA